MVVDIAIIKRGVRASAALKWDTCRPYSRWNRIPDGTARLRFRATDERQWVTTPTMNDSFIALTEIERDALAELSNIAMARAAGSLRQMVHNEVLLTVPSVDILSSEEAIKLVAMTNNR